MQPALETLSWCCMRAWRHKHRDILGVCEVCYGINEIMTTMSTTDMVWIGYNGKHRRRAFEDYGTTRLALAKGCLRRFGGLLSSIIQSNLIHAFSDPHHCNHIFKLLTKRLLAPLWVSLLTCYQNATPWPLRKIMRLSRNDKHDHHRFRSRTLNLTPFLLTPPIVFAIFALCKSS